MAASATSEAALDTAWPVGADGAAPSVQVHCYTHRRWIRELTLNEDSQVPTAERGKRSGVCALGPATHRHGSMAGPFFGYLRLSAFEPFRSVSKGPTRN